MNEQRSIGTILSDQETPTFEIVRIKLKSDQDVRPGTLVKIPVTLNSSTVTLIGRIKSAYEHNPNESPEDINVRDTLGLERNYPLEKDSTIIYRIVEADLIEEISGDGIRSPETLPLAGTDVFIAEPDEIMKALGLINGEGDGLFIGHTTSGTKTQIVLRRDAIQRHLFICGTTGSGKSYAMGVITEEIVKHGIPVVFLDTQDEYSSLVEKLGGKILIPGKDFNIRISSLTDRELIDLVPTDSDLHKNIITAAFLELQDEIKSGARTKFLLADLVSKVQQIGPTLTNRPDSVDLAIRRARFLEGVMHFPTEVPSRCARIVYVHG